MKPIKFRGKSIWTGKMLFGDLIHDDEKIFIRSQTRNFEVQVEPDSVAQFVGYDVDGNEIYSADTILENITEELNLIPMTRIAGYRIAVNDVGKTFKDFRLVKE